MKCGDCGTEMEEKKKRHLGEKVLVYICPGCGKSLISLDDAIKIQRRSGTPSA
jgi:DNA-directed RNA polymerase subunit RPC12/RpoP